MMQIVEKSLFLYLLLVQCLADVKQAPIDDFIKYYDKLNYDTQELNNKHLRIKRATQNKTLELRFTTHNRSFHLHLRPSTSVFTRNFRSTHSNGTEDFVDLSFIYEGSVLGEPGSRVHGAVILGIFRGTISIPSDTLYHIEPVYKFYGLNQAQKLPYHSVIYKEEHLVLNPYQYKEGIHSVTGSCGVDKYHDWMLHQTETEVDLHRKRIYYSHRENHNKYTSEINDPTTRGRRAAAEETCDNSLPNTCNLYLRSDPVLYNKFNADLGNNNEIAAKNEILSLFSSHVNALNEIFRRTRVKSTSKIPCFVQFQIQRTTVMTDTTENCNNALQKRAFCQGNLDVSNFLNLHSLSNHDDFCLAYTFTYRDFLQGTLGLAWVGSSTASSGGVCERHKSYREGAIDVKKSLNTGVVTLLNYGKRVPPRISELTFAHEVGHNMGSPHDDGKTCAQTTPDQGNYIMFASATKGNLPNNNDFSLCSKNSFTDVIAAVVNKKNGKYNCFTQSNMAFCGNGMVEEGEECDCGYDTDCTDKCCHPQQTTGSDSNACTLKINQTTNEKYNCSPSQGACCSSECEFWGTEKQCRPSTECLKAQNCSVDSSTCPESEKEPDLTFCDDFSQVCLNGFCSGSLCLKINSGYTTRWEQCFVRKTGDLTAKDRVELCYLACSAVCNDYEGVCDVFSRCRGMSDEGPLRRLTNLLFSEETLANIKNWIIEHWWATILIGIGLIVFMGIFIKGLSYDTPSTNPNIPVYSQNLPLREYDRRRKGELDTDSSHNKMVVRPDFLNIHRRSGSRFWPKEVGGVPKCTPNPCENNGFCRVHDTCICPAEYTGTLCEDHVLLRCGFENNMCTLGYENFTRTNSYSSIPAPAKGQYYALASGSAPEEERAIMATTLPVTGKSVRLDFDCATSGSGRLNVFYVGSSTKNVEEITTNGKWKSYSFNLQTGQNTTCSLFATVGKTGPGAVAIDNVKIIKPKEN